jgi:hypothetical protein
MSNITINSLPTANTIDASADILPIYTSSLTATQGINRNTFLGITGSPVGNTDSQTLTNKTIGHTNAVTQDDSVFVLQNLSDASKKAKFSLASITTSNTRTYTLPDVTDTLVSLTATQTLTNKTLTSPTISAPIVTNATLSADTITGFSSSTTGSIYGISVTSGTISNAALAASSVLTAAIADNNVTANKLSSAAITLGQAQRTTDFTTASATLVDITSLSVTVTIPTGSRRIKISFGAVYALTNGAAGTGVDFSIVDVTAGAEVGHLTVSQPVTSYAWNPNFFTTHVPASGSRTYKVQASTSAGTLTVHALSTSPAFILVEAI